MHFKRLVIAAGIAATTSLSAHAVTEIQWWHSMTAVNNEWVNDLAKEFNDSQKEYKVVPTFKGVYDESMTAAIAAFRSGNAPHILQVFEVGTATMMASKGATVSVGKVMSDAGVSFDPKAYIPAVAGYYTAPNGQMLSSHSTARRPSSITTRTPSRRLVWTLKKPQPPGLKCSPLPRSSRKAATAAP